MSTQDATQAGRAALVRWQDSQPADFYADDHELRELVAAHALGEREPSLHRTGRAVAGPLDRVVRANNLSRNLPVLDDYDGASSDFDVVAPPIRSGCFMPRLFISLAT